MIRLYIAGLAVTVATGVVFSAAYPAARLGIAWWTVTAIIVMTALIVAMCAIPHEPAMATGVADEDDCAGGWLPGDDDPVAPEPPLGGRVATVEEVDWAAEVEAIWAWEGDARERVVQRG